MMDEAEMYYWELDTRKGRMDDTQLCWAQGPIALWDGRHFVGSYCIAEKDHDGDHTFRPGSPVEDQ